MSFYQVCSLQIYSQMLLYMEALCSVFFVLSTRYLVCAMCINWDSRSSEKIAAKFRKRDTFIQFKISKSQNFNVHTSPIFMPPFCIGFGNDIGEKNLEKKRFLIFPISHKKKSQQACVWRLHSWLKIFTTPLKRKE